VAEAKFEEAGKEPGCTRKMTSGVTLNVLYQSWKVRKLRGDYARKSWQAPGMNAEEIKRSK
jgi:hypothetical protein